MSQPCPKTCSPHLLWFAGTAPQLPAASPQSPPTSPAACWIQARHRLCPTSPGVATNGPSHNTWKLDKAVVANLKPYSAAGQPENPLPSGMKIRGEFSTTKLKEKIGKVSGHSVLECLWATLRSQHLRQVCVRVACKTQPIERGT